MTKAVRENEQLFEARKWREASKNVNNPYPEEWAVYDIESGVRVKYADSKEQAIRLAEAWNAGKIPSKELAKVESARTLKKLLKPGDTVQTILRNVSRSGMSRRISCVIARDGEVQDITWDVARVTGESVKGRAGYVQDVGIAVGGCGMDMGFNLVYNLSRVLFPDGFACIGNGCPSNDHSNGDRDYTPHDAVVTSGCRHCGKLFKPALTTCPKCVKPTNAMLRADHMHAGDGGYALKQRWL
jgi:hypothetical protein